MEQEDLVVSNTSSRTGEMSMDEKEEASATLHVSVSSALESPRKKQRLTIITADINHFA